MNSREQERKEQEIRELYDFIAEQVLAGLYKREIIEKVIELGIDRITASELVAEIERRMQNIRRRTILLMSGGGTTNARLMKELEICGYKTVQARKSEDVPGLLTKVVPDLIIMDAPFRGKRAHESLKNIRHDPIGRKVPVFVLGGRKLMKEAMLNHGLVEFFELGTSQEDVVSRVKRILFRPKGI